MNNIENKIYKIRGVEVMLDSDLAELYHVETKRINEAVKNNPDKFPQKYSFVLEDNESNNFLVENFDQKKETRGGRYKNPRVFTEQGVYMLATILKSKIAVEITIRIIESFVKMRHYINYNQDLLPNRILLLENKVDDNTKRIDELFDKFNPIDITNNHLFFEGHFYDSYSFFLDILNRSKKEIIIIDNYCSKELLDILKDINRKIIIVSKNIDETLKTKYEKQYNNVTFIYNNSIHDRFIILDKKELYTSGSSFKDIGKKCFYIGKIETQDNLSRLLEELKMT